MDPEKAKRHADEHSFPELYGHTSYPQYIEACKAARARGEDWADAHLAEHERAERLDFDSWKGVPYGIYYLASYATKNGRCDIIEKYAPRWPDVVWNQLLSMWYTPCLYPILALVMPLPVKSTLIAYYYVAKGLYREVVIHMLGRKCSDDERVITLESIAEHASRAQDYENLGEIGLDLGDPQHLYRALTRNGHGAVAFLRQHCTRLDEVMPDGKTLRSVLPL